MKIVRTALFMALTTISTMFIRIPLPFGYVNLGDVFVLLSVFVLGPLWGTVCAGFGSALADLFGYAIYAPGTLIIKSLMAIIAWLIYYVLFKRFKKRMLAQIVAGIVGAIVMAFGYFVYESLFFISPAVAIASFPYNVIQGAIGTALAVCLMKVLVATKVVE